MANTPCDMGQSPPQGISNIMCWLSDWIRLIHPMHWFQSLLRSSRRLKPQISHGFLAPFEGFLDASPGVLQVWENVGIQVIMGLSTGIPMARRLPPQSGSHPKVV